MLIIVITVITQGARVDSEYKGDLRGSLLVRNGVFQAIGVISFGNEFHDRFTLGAVWYANKFISVRLS